MVRYLYHAESDSFFVSPEEEAERHIGVWDCTELGYLDWMRGRAYREPVESYPNGANIVTGLCGYLSKHSIPQGFTTLNNDTYWYVNTAGTLCGITLSKYSEYWQAQILDIIFPYIKL